MDYAIRQAKKDKVLNYEEPKAFSYLEAWHKRWTFDFYFSMPCL